MWARPHLRPFPQVPELEAQRWRVPKGPRAPRRVRIAAWLRRPWLDAALAAGADPAGSPLLAHRAAILVSRPYRNRLARAVRNRREAAKQGPELLSPAVAVDAREVTAAAPQLEELECLLRSPEPVYCPGMARGWRLITDGCGPLYAPRSPGQLGREVGAVLAALRRGG